MEIRLPGKWSPHSRPKFTYQHGQIRTYYSASTVITREALALAAKEAMIGEDVLAGPVMLTIRVFLPIPSSWPEGKRTKALGGLLRPTHKRSGDFDNWSKIVDALNGITWEDDSQIVDSMFGKWYGKNPGLLITIGGA